LINKYFIVFYTRCCICVCHVLTLVSDLLASVLDSVIFCVLGSEKSHGKFTHSTEVPLKNQKPKEKLYKCRETLKYSRNVAVVLGRYKKF